jgi:hypothetical protein
MADRTVTLKDFLASPDDHDWCPDCGAPVLEYSFNDETFAEGRFEPCGHLIPPRDGDGTTDG